MGKANFTFNNISSLDYLTIQKMPSIIRGARNVKKVEVDGRDGFLTEDLGTYASTIKNAECYLKDIESLNFINSWLTGTGDVIFSNEPDKIYKATILNQIEFIKVKAVRDYKTFIVIFECQPYKLSLANDIITLIANGSAIYNPSAVNSKPIIKIYGTGNISLAIGDSPTVNLYDIVGNITMDSQVEEAFSGNKLLNNNMSGEFPQLSPGPNKITWSGNVTKIEINGNWRWL